MQAGVVLVLVVVSALLTLSYRDRRGVYLPDQLAALLAMLTGVSLGMLWECVEFLLDWVLLTDFQPTNSDTMSDLLATAIVSVVGGVLSVWLYCHSLQLQPLWRRRAGDLAGWLLDGPNGFLDRHGVAMTLVVSALAVLAVAGLWFAGRPVPGFPIG